MHMKSILLTVGSVLLSLEMSHAVAITLGQTAGGARFFTTAGAPVPSEAKVSMGWMSNPTDANSFIEFASTAMHGNTVFTTGVGTIAGNSQAAELKQAAGKNIYIRVTGESGGGIWMSSTLYPADLDAASVTPGSASLTTDTWTVVNPTLNWVYTGAKYVADTAPLGLSDASATPTERTGDAFTLGVPEPSGAVLSVLALGAIFARRKR